MDKHTGQCLTYGKYSIDVSYDFYFSRTGQQRYNFHENSVGFLGRKNKKETVRLIIGHLTTHPKKMKDVGRKTRKSLFPIPVYPCCSGILDTALPLTLQVVRLGHRLFDHVTHDPRSDPGSE